MSIPENFNEVVALLAKIFTGYQYALRGTASLALQNIEMNVLDIDIVCDKKTALAANKLLADYLIEQVEYKESPKFRSYFGKFEIKGIPVEIMGEWEIKDTKDQWSEPFDGSGNQKVSVKVDGNNVFTTPINTELAMFAKMGRWTAFQKIKKQLPSEVKLKKESPQPTLF